jgi:hypothetical protein
MYTSVGDPAGVPATLCVRMSEAVTMCAFVTLCLSTSKWFPLIFRKA